MRELELLSSLVEQGKAKDVLELVQALIDQGVESQLILDQGLLKGMNEIGLKWKVGKAFIPEVLISARALNQGMELLQKGLVKNPEKKQEEIVIIGTVKGDRHDIGKNLVGMMIKSKGFKVIDLGTDVDSATFIEAVKTHHARFVCLSALLTTTMLYFKTIVEDFKKAGLRDHVTILCGGAPVSEEFSRECGCDYYRSDAVGCADLIAEKAGQGSENNERN